MKLFRNLTKKRIKTKEAAKRVMIVGVASRLGTKVARSFSANNRDQHVIFVNLPSSTSSTSSLDALVMDCNSLGANVTLIELNTTYDEFVQTVLKDYGKLDGLIIISPASVPTTPLQKKATNMSSVLEACEVAETSCFGPLVALLHACPSLLNPNSSTLCITVPTSSDSLTSAATAAFQGFIKSYQEEVSTTWPGTFEALTVLSQQMAVEWGGSESGGIKRGWLREQLDRSLHPTSMSPSSPRRSTLGAKSRKSTQLTHWDIFQTTSSSSNNQEYGPKDETRGRTRSTPVPPKLVVSPRNSSDSPTKEVKIEKNPQPNPKEDDLPNEAIEA
eukprot:TRINITY_DN12902_c0_g1_i1.p1 TRINITY_DN12902_c0_g1~~TRINITY_DN12902_c0_g1_i1.p1  ORF type:complete len:331 (-),score=72.29 TRINITY_DN12902_c0_g1_i1:22-1014(-)